MENEHQFFIFHWKWKMKNGCSFSIFHFPLKMENGNNGMYTDQPTIFNFSHSGTLPECQQLKMVG